MAKFFPKRLAVIFLAAGLLMPIFGTSALAHSLSEDGKISGFLHIAPDDTPQAGQLNDIRIYYNDQDFKFTTENCDCKIKITQNTASLYNGTLPASGMRIGEIKVLLPEDNQSYGVVVSGVPKTAGFFQPFKLNFDIKVGSPSKVVNEPQKKPTIAVISGIILSGGIGLGIVQKRAKIKESNRRQ